MNYRPFVKYLLLGILSLGIAPNLFAQLSLGGLPSETISTKQLRSISTESEEFVVVLPLLLKLRSNAFLKKRRKECLLCGLCTVWGSLKM